MIAKLAISSAVIRLMERFGIVPLWRLVAQLISASIVSYREYIEYVYRNSILL